MKRIIIPALLVALVTVAACALVSHRITPLPEYASDAELAEMGIAEGSDLWCAIKYQVEGYGVDEELIRIGKLLLQLHREEKEAVAMGIAPHFIELARKLILFMDNHERGLIEPHEWAWFRSVAPVMTAQGEHPDLKNARPVSEEEWLGIVGTKSLLLVAGVLEEDAGLYYAAWEADHSEELETSAGRATARNNGKPALKRGEATIPK